MRHVVLGAGPVGQSAAAALAARNLDVTVVSRSRPAGWPDGLRHVTADVLDATALRSACEGARVIYQCLNAPYHQWRERFPPLQAAAVAAAQAVNARYVSFENLYAYGAPGSVPFVERQGDAPCSEKGRVRAEMTATLRRLQAEGALDVAFVRASDLFGPGMRDSALGNELLGRAVAGKGARGYGDLDAPHTWTFTRDAGETLAAAGTAAKAGGRVWHVPSERARSQREVVAEVSRVLERPVSLSATPPLVLRLVGLFQPAAAELLEMKYEFDRPFVVDDALTRRELGVASTPFAEALGTTVGWFRSAAAGR